MKLHVGQADVYKQRHDDIWPELSSGLLEAGVIDFRIYLDAESHVLVALMTCRPDHHLQALRQSELMYRWWSMMSDIMETNADLSPREWPLIPMFHLHADSEVAQSARGIAAAEGSESKTPI